MKKRPHKNTSRLTAKERTVAIIRGGALAADIEKALQAHAREAVDRYKRRRSGRLIQGDEGLESA